jgi:hypothetical protein
MAPSSVALQLPAASAVPLAADPAAAQAALLQQQQQAALQQQQQQAALLQQQAAARAALQAELAAQAAAAAAAAAVRAEVPFNEAPPRVRHILTKRSTQQELEAKWRVVVVVRGRYLPPGQASASEREEDRPLFLRITPSKTLPAVRTTRQAPVSLPAQLAGQLCACWGRAGRPLPPPLLPACCRLFLGADTPAGQPPSPLLAAWLGVLA